MKENTPNKTPIITLEGIAQRKAEKLEEVQQAKKEMVQTCLLYTSPSPRDS